MSCARHADLYMAGPPGEVALERYTDGPSPHSANILQFLEDGYIYVGKTLSGDLVFREQFRDGRFYPWTPPNDP
jgi:hypothetical protein